MPLDGTPNNGGGGDEPILPGLSCIVVGGCANGAFLPAVQLGAERIRLSRPAYIRPLASAVQKVPEIANEEDDYIIHPLGLQESADAPVAIMGVAVVAGRSLQWAFKQLVSGYAQNVVTELRAAGINPPTNQTDKKEP